MLLFVIQYYYIGVMVSLFLLYFILEKNSFSREVNFCFILSALCTLFLSLSDAAETLLAMKTYPTTARILVSACGYVFRPAVAYLVLQIAIRKASRVVKWLSSIPMIFEIIVSFSALFTDIAFGYDAHNQFYRGPLGITPFVIGALYGILLVVATFWLVRKAQWEEGMFVLIIAIVNVSGTVLESIYKLDGILPSSIAVSVTFYYLFFHTYQNDRDALTGVLLRRKFYQNAQKWGSSITGVVSIDLNGLKELNDHYGHNEGDKAIKTLADCVESVRTQKASFYRTGGDEFMMLCRKMSEDEIQEMIQKIRQKMKQTEYSCALGYAMFDFEQGLEEVCQKADENMYENKIQIKD